MCGVVLSLLVADPEDPEQQVDGIQVQADRDVDGIVDRRRDAARTVHVETDVQREESCRREVDHLELHQRGDEQRHNEHHQERHKCTCECAADRAIEIREHEARHGHHARHHRGRRRCLRDDSWLRELVHRQHGPQDCPKWDHHEIEPDEGDERRAAPAQEDAQKWQSQPDDQEHDDSRLPRRCHRRDDMRGDETPGEHGSHHEVERAPGHVACAETLINL